MTQAERDVVEAACAAVRVEVTGSLIVANMVKDEATLGVLVRAVMRLDKERKGGGYWRET